MFAMLRQDLRRKAEWIYGSERWPAILKVLLTGGTAAMILYRLMQWSRRHRLAPLELICNKLLAVCCQCIIGRGVEFGPGLVFVQSNGLVINGRVRGGSNVTLYHQVTLGGEQDQVPVLGDNVLIAAGAKVVGPFRIADGATVAVNSAVFRNVPPGTTVMGVPAEPVWQDGPRPASPNGRSIGPEAVPPSPRGPSVRADPGPSRDARDSRLAGLEARLIPCFAAAFPDLGPEQIPEASVSSVAGWDSMASMTLLALIEEEFRLRIPVLDLPGLTSFSAALAYLQEHAAGDDGHPIGAGRGRDHAR